MIHNRPGGIREAVVDVVRGQGVQVSLGFRSVRYAHCTTPQVTQCHRFAILIQLALAFWTDALVTNSCSSIRRNSAVLVVSLLDDVAVLVASVLSPIVRYPHVMPLFVSVEVAKVDEVRQ